MGKRAGVLRERESRIFAVGAGWRKSQFERQRGRIGRQGAQRGCLSRRVGVVVATVASDVADSWHPKFAASGGQLRGGKTQIDSGGVALCGGLNRHRKVKLRN